MRLTWCLPGRQRSVANPLMRTLETLLVNSVCNRRDWLQKWDRQIICSRAARTRRGREPCRLNGC